MIHALFGAGHNPSKYTREPFKTIPYVFLKKLMQWFVKGHNMSCHLTTSIEPYYVLKQYVCKLVITRKRFMSKKLWLRICMGNYFTNIANSLQNKFTYFLFQEFILPYEVIWKNIDYVLSFKEVFLGGTGHLMSILLFEWRLILWS